MKVTCVFDGVQSLCRGSNKLVLEEADRSLHDALCVVRCLVNKRYLISGGGSAEMEITHQLSQFSKKLQVREAADVVCSMDALGLLQNFTVHGSMCHTWVHAQFSMTVWDGDATGVL